MYSHNSKKIENGQIFLCLPGGEKYIDEAIKNGAKEVIKVNRIQMAEIANKFYKNPSQKLDVIGITGTNGKTTVAHLVAEALNHFGKNAKVLGTINSELTTPESLEIIKSMHEHLSNGGTHFIMEVSSHAIAQNRIYGINFKIKCLTNITEDHIDYHGSVESYKQTKLNFLKEGNNIKIYPENYINEKINFINPLKGEFNIQNLKLSKAILKALDFEENKINQQLQIATAPEGRFEVINNNQEMTIIVDFAHTPDGLEKILVEGKKLANEAKGRLLCVFGCGGNRDTTKRPKMGKIASDLTDYFIITADNPRYEALEIIMTDIKKGISKNTDFYSEIHDRKKAIEAIILMAKKNDVVVVAGKGHETYQIIGSNKEEFSDKKEIQNALNKRMLNEN